MILLSVTFNMHAGVYNVRGGRGLIRDPCPYFYWVAFFCTIQSCPFIQHPSSSGLGQRTSTETSLHGHTPHEHHSGHATFKAWFIDICQIPKNDMFIILLGRKSSHTNFQIAPKLDQSTGYNCQGTKDQGPQEHDLETSSETCVLAMHGLLKPQVSSLSGSVSTCFNQGKFFGQEIEECIIPWIRGQLEPTCAIENICFDGFTMVYLSIQLK